MFRRHLIAVLLALSAVAAGTGLAACGRPDEDASLRYSVAERDSRVTATISDNRSGKHTVWVVLTEASTAHSLGPLTAWNYGDRGPGESESGSTTMALAPGTYEYAVYDVEGIVTTNVSSYWTAEHRVASGEVTVP